MKNSKRFVAAGLVAAMVLSLAACGAKDNGNAPASTPAAEGEQQELTPITFCLDWTPNTNHTGFYVAQAQGYYAEAGLDVQIVQPPENGAAMMCASGQAQFAIEAQDTIASAFDLEEPLAVTAVAGLIQHNTSGIISRAGEGLENPKGLEGHTYSTWESPTELAMLENVVSMAGGDYSQIQLIPNDITDEPAALAANQTDAIWIFYGWGGVNAQIEEVPVDFFYFKDINPVFDYYTPILIANNEFLEQDADTAKAFIEATRKGYEYAMEHPQEAADMLIAGDNTGSLQGSEDLVYASQEYMNSQYVTEGETWGVIDAERWDGFYGWLYENGLSTHDLSGTGYSNDYLPQ